jgi:outer membrane protein W
MKKGLLVLLVVSSSALFAQSGELWVSGGASLIAPKTVGSPIPNGGQSDITIGNGFRFGFRFDLNSDGHIGHEIQYAYNRTDLTDNTGAILGDVGSAGIAIHQAGYNVLYYLHETRKGSKVRPFFTAGVHFSDFVLPGSGGPQGSSVKFGAISVGE